MGTKAAAATHVHFNYVTPDRDLGPESQHTPSNAATLAAQKALKEKREGNNIPRAPFRMRRRRRSRNNNDASNDYHNTGSNHSIFTSLHRSNHHAGADVSHLLLTPAPSLPSYDVTSNTNTTGCGDAVHMQKPPPIQRKPPNPNRMSLADSARRAELESSVRALAFSPGCHSTC